MLAALLAWVVLAASPLDDAKAHLAAGKLDDVLFDLDGKSFPEDQRATAAAVLAEASRAALEAKDLVLSLQFAQMALRHDKKQALALETGARASFAQDQYDPAEDYADRWIAAAPQSGRPRLLRAELSLAQGEWAKVIALTRELDARTLSNAERARLLEVVQAANKELGERDAARGQARALQKQLEKQINEASTTLASSRANASGSRPVIVYSTAWCGYCRSAKAWLTAHQVPFVEKDIEKDPEAEAELAAMKKAVGKERQGGVPWIDTGSELLAGFDVPALERLFPRK
jgi:glutaredoxin